MTRMDHIKGEQTPETQARMAGARNGLYAFLAAIFRQEMTDKLLQSVLEPEFLNTLVAFGVQVSSFASLKPDQASVDKLVQDYTRLFMGPGTHVSPYESVHLGGAGGGLWGPETTAVKKFIEASGFVYDESFHGLPDHISVELEYMDHMTRLEAKAWEDGDRDQAENCRLFQKGFLSEHLCRWSGKFSDKVQETASGTFYGEMAALMRDFVEAEFRDLNEI